MDAHVGKALFQDAIQSLVLQGKTVILVTHAIHFLPEVDYIYTLLDGRIQEQGTYSELIDAGGVFSVLVRDFGHGGSLEPLSNEPDEEMDSYPADKIDTHILPASTTFKSRGKAEGTGKMEGFLIRAEQRKHGAISKSGRETVKSLGV